MNLNVEKAKQLITIFSELSDEKQDELLSSAYEMKIKQSIASNVKKSGKPANKENVDEAIGKFVDVVHPLMNTLDKLDPNHQAALAIMLNEMSNGTFAKEQYVDFVVKTRQLSITEYIEKYIPAADIDEARKIYRLMKDNK